MFFPSFCRKVERSVVAPFAVKIITDLTPLLPQTSEDVLVLLLETLASVIAVDDGHLGSDLCGAVADVVLNVWVQNSRGASC